MVDWLIQNIPLAMERYRQIEPELPKSVTTSSTLTGRANLGSGQYTDVELEVRVHDAVDGVLLLPRARWSNTAAIRSDAEARSVINALEKARMRGAELAAKAQRLTF